MSVDGITAALTWLVGGSVAIPLCRRHGMAPPREAWQGTEGGRDLGNRVGQARRPVRVSAKALRLRGSIRFPPPEQGAYFRSLDLDPDLLPRRLYKGALTPTVRDFPMGHAIAADAGRVTFVYPDPGFATDQPLRYWARAHARLRTALRRTGTAVHIVAVLRTGVAARQPRGRAHPDRVIPVRGLNLNGWLASLCSVGPRSAPNPLGTRPKTP